MYKSRQIALEHSAIALCELFQLESVRTQIEEKREELAKLQAIKSFPTTEQFIQQTQLLQEIKSLEFRYFTSYNTTMVRAKSLFDYFMQNQAPDGPINPELSLPE